MLGYYRLFLAFCVMLSHFDVIVYTLDIGKMAVFSFFVLAGYVSTKVYTNVYNLNAFAFLKDRFLRIYPAYFIMTTLAYIFFFITKYEGFETNLTKIALTYLVIPLNYIQYIDVAQLTKISNYAFNFILPPYWSLGAEIQVYLAIAILLAIFGRKTFIFLIYLSLVFFTIGNIQAQNALSYVILLGTFWSFGLGYLYAVKSYKHLIAVSYFVMINVSIAFASNSYGVESGLGAVLAIIILFIQSKLNTTYAGNRLCGNLSYHIFLSHFLFIYVSKWLCGEINYIMVVFGSVIFSLFMLKVDKYTDKIRKIK